MYIWKFWYKINVIKNYYGDISYAKAFSQFNKPLRFILNATYFKKSFSCSQSDSNGNSVQRRLYPSLWLSDCWNSSPPKKLGPLLPTSAGRRERLRSGVSQQGRLLSPVERFHTVATAPQSSMQARLEPCQLPGLGRSSIYTQTSGHDLEWDFVPTTLFCQSSQRGDVEEIPAPTLTPAPTDFCTCKTNQNNAALTSTRRHLGVCLQLL